MLWNPGRRSPLREPPHRWHEALAFALLGHDCRSLSAGSLRRLPCNVRFGRYVENRADPNCSATRRTMGLLQLPRLRLLTARLHPLPTNLEATNLEATNLARRR